jgi:hypothetical protein
MARTIEQINMSIKTLEGVIQWCNATIAISTDPAEIERMQEKVIETQFRLIKYGLELDDAEEAARS